MRTHTPQTDDVDESDTLREAYCQLNLVIDRLVHVNPRASPAVHALLGAIAQQRKQKANPEVAPLHDNIRDGDTFTKADLLQHSDDGFDYKDLINDPDDDPSYHTKNTPKSTKDEYLEVLGPSSKLGLNRGPSRTNLLGRLGVFYRF